MSIGTSHSDLKIIGDNRASGGSYKNAKIIGDSIINGNLDCSDLKCVGDSRFNGDIKAHRAKIVGSVHVTGSVEADFIRVTGNIDANGDLDARTVELRGGLDIKGSLKSDHAKMVGYTSIKKNCEAETFESDGPITIGGLLNANEVNLRIHSRCRIGEIGGGIIEIKKGHYSKWLELIKSFFAPNDAFGTRLTVDSIEGDEIQLEDTKAKVVRGKNIFVGDGCEIDSLEYSEECRITGRATVKEKRKISA